MRSKERRRVQSLWAPAIFEMNAREKDKYSGLSAFLAGRRKSGRSSRRPRAPTGSAAEIERETEGGMGRSHPTDGVASAVSFSQHRRSKFSNGSGAAGDLRLDLAACPKARYRAIDSMISVGPPGLGQNFLLGPNSFPSMFDRVAFYSERCTGLTSDLIRLIISPGKEKIESRPIRRVPFTILSWFL